MWLFRWVEQTQPGERAVCLSSFCPSRLRGSVRSQVDHSVEWSKAVSVELTTRRAKGLGLHGAETVSSDSECGALVSLISNLTTLV